MTVCGVMKTSALDCRLLAAALDCRDDLRSLIPRLDRVIAAGEDSTGLLTCIRAAAYTHADALRLAIKGRGIATIPRGRAKSYAGAIGEREGRVCGRMGWTRETYGLVCF